MTEVYVAGAEGPAKKNQWSLMTNDKVEAEFAVETNEGWTMKQVPPENLKPRRRQRRGR